MKIKSGTGTDMLRYGCGMAAVILLLANAASGWSQQYFLYAPRPVAAEEKVEKKDGVLVQEVQVRKGDTLSGISRKFSGRGSYYPQILLFNDVKNPDRIYPGNVLKIPVSKMNVPKKVSVSPEQVEKGRDGGEAKPEPKRKATGVRQPDTADIQASKRAAAPQPKESPPAVASGQKLYERAVTAYRQDDFAMALKLFDRFLVENPDSLLAADASLYKAECYLKQAGQ
jgi:LysM repeat protein